MSLKYAVISDVHGNILAFEAVLKHAERQGVDNFIFLGDYCGLGNTNKIAYMLRQFAGKVAKLHGESQMPFSDKVWNEAISTWVFDDEY